MKSFVLIATQRSGTTAFRACLNNEPGIKMYGEAFFPSLFDWGYYSFFSDAVRKDAERALPGARGASYREYFETLVSLHPDQHVGIDVKYSDMESNPGLYGALGGHFDVVIHMRRSNILRTILSNESMKQRVAQKMIPESKIHSTSAAPKIRVTLDPDRIVSMIDGLERQIARYDATLDDRFDQVVRVTYETAFVQAGDQTSIAPAVRSALCSALALDDAEAKPFLCSLRKQNIWSLDEMIANYDEVAKVLNRSRYYHMLDD